MVKRLKWQHWTDNPIFYSPTHDKYRKLYYRIQLGEFCEYFYGEPTPYDKKIVLSVFNDKLEMLSELRLEIITNIISSSLELQRLGLSWVVIIRKIQV